MSSKKMKQKEHIKAKNSKQKQEAIVEETKLSDNIEKHDIDEKFKHREVLSNWAKYEKELMEEHAQTHIVNDFSTMLQTSATVNPQFQYKNILNEDFPSSGEEFNNHLSLDLNYLSSLLDCIPLHERYDLSEDIFNEEDIKNFCDEAAASEILFKSKYPTNANAPKNYDFVPYQTFDSFVSKSDPLKNNDLITDELLKCEPFINTKPLPKRIRTKLLPNNKINEFEEESNIIAKDRLNCTTESDDNISLLKEDKSEITDIILANDNEAKNTVIKDEDAEILNIKISDNKDKAEIKNKKENSLENIPDIETLEAELESFLNL